jgi:serine/threonine protein kinase/Leucine-rich repeat (LRR) protein
LQGVSTHDQHEEAIFNAASKLPAKERALYLDDACSKDDELRERIAKRFVAADSGGASVGKPTALPFEQTVALHFVPPSAGEMPGDHVGRYKLLERIGEGGMGSVWVAEQIEPVRRQVALKVIKLGMDTKQVVARFEAERQALALMDHPSIARVLDAGATESGRPFFAMELVKGIPITEYCDKHNSPTADRLALFIHVCQAVQHAHQKGIIHRDIKPSNILVTLQGGRPIPKVIDFGIAKATAGQRLTDKTLHTALEEFIGTPAYTSPEQIEMSGLNVDTRSDIYSLGVLLYELLTGKTPFEPKELLAAGFGEMRRILREKEPLRPSTRVSTLKADEQTTIARRRRSDPPKLVNLIQGDLDWIVMKALDKDRTRRYETANGLGRDVERHLGNEPVIARPPSRLYRFQRAVKRHRWAFTAASAVAFSLAAGITASLWQAVRATRAERSVRATLDELRGTAPAFIEQARMLTSELRYDEALQKLDYAIKLRPDSADYLIKKGDMLECQLRLKEALEAYRAALHIDPGNARTETNLALCQRLLEANPPGNTISRSDSSELFSLMQDEQRPMGELMPVAKILGNERNLIVEQWTTLAKALPIPYNESPGARLQFQANGLAKLDLAKTGLTDLAPLRDLPIEILILDETPLTTLDPLRGSSLGHTLRELGLYKTKVTDLSPLQDCPNIQSLGITYIPVSDLAPLRSTHLKRLYASYTEVADLTPLRDLPLEHLFLEQCHRATNVLQLAGITTLKEIILPSGARNIDALRSLPNLERIGFAWQPGIGPDKTAQEFWSDWDKRTALFTNVLARLKDLPLTAEKPLRERLLLRGDRIVGLNLSETSIGNIASVRDLPLESLDLGGTPVKDLLPLRGSILARHLQVLRIWSTQIQDLSPLADCTNLEALDITSAPVSDLSVLARTHLHELYAGWTKVSDLAPLRGLPIEALMLNDCPNLTDVRLLAEIPSLRQVTIPSDARRIESLRTLPNLVRIGFARSATAGFPNMTATEFWAAWDRRTNHLASPLKQ